MNFKAQTWKALAAAVGLFARICADQAVRGLFFRADCGLSPTAMGRLVIGVTAMRMSERRFDRVVLARGAFDKVPDAALARHALPEAVAALAGSDPERARALLRVGVRRRRRPGSPHSRLSLATASAYLGHAEGVEEFTAGLKDPETDRLKQRFAAQQRVASKLGVSADYPSVCKAARKIVTGKQNGPIRIGLPDECDLRDCMQGRADRGLTGGGVEVVPVDRDFPLALAALDGPVWLPVSGDFGRQAYSGHLDFPFPGNVRPLFTAIHIAGPVIPNSPGSAHGTEDEVLAYLRRFAPTGCRDLFTARVLRAAGIEAFVAEGAAPIPQPVLDAILEGGSEAEVYALWRKVTAPAMARTGKTIAERNAKYPPPEVRLEDFGLERIEGRSFGHECESASKSIQLLFAFDDNHAEHFPGTLEGVWRHSSRPLVVHIFGRGLSAAMFEQWAVQFARNGAPARACEGVRFIHYDLSSRANLGDINLFGHITISTMDRLLAPALLPEVEKILYLDTDILVRADISELFDTELGDARLAARPGGVKFPELYADGALPKEKLESFRNALFSGGGSHKPFNAGVLVMNLAQMRRDRTGEKALGIARSFGFHDQDALILATGARLRPLAREWNYHPPFDALDDPAALHFHGLAKPWSRSFSAATLVQRIKDWAHCGDDHARFRAYRREWRENAERASKRVLAQQ